MSSPDERTPKFRENEASLEKAGATTQLVESAAPVSPWLPLALASALFMELLDTAALGTALPTLAREFHADPLHLKLALTAYLMTMAVFVPCSGWLADRYGARRIFINAMKVYLLGSVCCGLSSSVPELVASRVLQGLGGAMMTPVARLIVVASTPRERLVKALNAFTFPAVIGPLLGPPLAGLLLHYASWRWIFFINLPVGLLGIYLVLRLVPRLRHPHPGRFDGVGFVLAGVAIIAFVVVAEMLGSGLVSAGIRTATAALGLFAFTGYIIHARRVDNPMLDLQLLSISTYRASLLGSTAMRFGIGATPFLMALLLQTGLGWTPLKSGMVMMSIIAGSLLARVAGTAGVKRLGFRALLVATGLASAIMTVLPMLFRTDTPVIMIVIALGMLGFMRATHFVAASALTFAEVKPEQVSRASTLATVIQQLGLSMGISVAGLALSWGAGARTDTAPYSPENFALPFIVLALVGLLTVPVYATLQRDAAAHMRYGN